MRSKADERDAQRPASAHAERERNTRAQRGCSLAHRAAMGYPLRADGRTLASGSADDTVQLW
ncbi:hypothetical protein, partial [Streptomyces violaceorubidus]